MIKVRKQKRGKPFQHMWMGKCSCGYELQYWAWGATLGAMLQHHWKEHS